MEAAGKLCELPLLDCVQRGCFLFFLSTRMMIFPSVISLSFPSGAHGLHPGSLPAPLLRALCYHWSSSSARLLALAPV
jgi:hypothetical protein